MSFLELHNISEVESSTQSLRSRTQKKSEDKALERLFEDSRSQKEKGAQVPKILHFVKVFDDNLKRVVLFLK